MNGRAILTAGLLLVAVPAVGQSGLGGWIADAHTECKVWDPNPQPNESVTWSGACRNGLAQGHGVLQWFQDGKPSERGEGEWLDGKRTGHGGYTMASGEHYEGEWRDSTKNGHGVKVWASGSRYDGEWRNDKKNGQGTEVLANGTRYDGQWQDDVPNGPGTAVWPDGARADGVWVNGCLRNGSQATAWSGDRASCQ
jgi:hypothetical protein